MHTRYFESSLPFDELLSGVKKYNTVKNDYCIIKFASGIIVIATTHATLIDRFAINSKFKEIELTRDELYFRMADVPLKQSIGNPNLLPLI